MSNAISSVLGGGNILGAALNIAGALFPPLGIATSLANMVTGAVGQAVGQAAQQLTKELGMPKFLQDIIGKVVDQVCGGMQKPSDPGCDQRCGNDKGVKDWKHSFIQDMVKSIVDEVKEEMGKDAKCGGSGKKSSGSWLEALSKALGKVAGEKAAKMVDLTNQISGLSGDSSPEAAQKMTELNGELSGTGKMFSLLQETMNTTVKSIGDGLTTIARKS